MALLVGTLSSRLTVAAADALPHVTAIAYSPDGGQIIVGSQSGLSIRSAQSPHPAKDVLKTGVSQVHDVTFSSEGDLVAVAGGVPGESGVVELIEWPSGQLRQRLESHDDVVYCVEFAGGQSTWVAASADEVCSVYQLGNDTAVSRFTKHSRAVLAVTMLPDGKTAVSASRDETLRVWDCATGESLRTLHNHSRQVNDLALKPLSDGLPLVASASDDRTVRLWQPTIGRMVRFARLPSEPLTIAWLGDGSAIVAGCRDGKARLIDPVTVEVIDTFNIGDGWLYAVDVDPTDDRRVVMGGGRGLIQTLAIPDA